MSVAQQTSGRSGDFKPFIVLALAMAVPVGAGIYSLMLTKAPTTVSNHGFNVLKVEPSKDQHYYGSGGAATASNDASPMPLVGRLKVSPAMRPDPAPGTSGSSYGSRSEGPMTPQRAKEKQFLSSHGAELDRYGSKLNRITTRYYRSDPVVREVDRSFGQLPRYMAVKHRYERDHDPFQFVRDSVALPEVRSEISKHMRNPRVWKASLGMIFDALRDPPPPAIYNAAKELVTKDGQVSDYMNGFTTDVFTNMPTNADVLPPNADMGLLWNVVKDIRPEAAAMGTATAAAQQPKRH